VHDNGFKDFELPSFEGHDGAGEHHNFGGAGGQHGSHEDGSSSEEGSQGAQGGPSKDGKAMFMQYINDSCPAGYNQTALFECLKDAKPPAPQQNDGQAHPTGGKSNPGGKPAWGQHVGKPSKSAKGMGANFDLSKIVCPIAKKCGEGCPAEISKIQGLICHNCTSWKESKADITSCLPKGKLGDAIGEKFDQFSKMFCDHDIDCNKPQYQARPAQKIINLRAKSNNGKITGQ